VIRGLGLATVGGRRRPRERAGPLGVVRTATDTVALCPRNVRPRAPRARRPLGMTPSGTEDGGNSTDGVGGTVRRGRSRGLGGRGGTAPDKGRCEWTEPNTGYGS